MKYNQYVVNGVKINVVEDDIKNLRLLQPDKSKVNLDVFRYTDKLLYPSALINGSYGDDSYGYALGRCQGDVYQHASSFKEQQYLGFAITEDGYKCGELEYWDVEKSICGFTPALICIKDGQDVKMCTTSFDITYDYKLNLATGITFMGILSDKKTVHLITAERGMSGTTLLKWAKNHWQYDFLCELDGGGSSQMIVNREWVQKSTDGGGKRKVYSALAFVESEQPQPKSEEYIDISTYQKNVDYKAIKDSGIKGAIIRCGYTGYGDMCGHKDALFEEHYKGFKSVGLPVGAYYYSCANSLETARKEAYYTLELLKDKQFELPIFMDVENAQKQDSLSYDLLTNIVKEFVKVLSDSNYYCGVYASVSWLTKKFNADGIETWCAQYNSVCQYAKEYSIWQYTSSGKVNGISGNVDMNKVYKDFSFIKEQGLNGFSQEDDKDKIIAELKQEVEKLKAEKEELKHNIELLKNDIGKINDEKETLQDKINKVIDLLSKKEAINE